ncbi:hypothetical protein H0H87_009314, partial [Tephrocybe sp. NHM501043]
MDRPLYVTNLLPKVVAARISRRNTPREVLQATWLDNMITIVSGIRDASDMIPFPYVKVAAGIVLQVLLKIQ